MSEIDDIKRRAGIVCESVIYQENPQDPSNPEVLVNGVGRYNLKTLKDNVRGKLMDLAKRSGSDSPMEWRNIGQLINHAAMREMIKTIVAAEEELEGKKGEKRIFYRS